MTVLDRPMGQLARNLTRTFGRPAVLKRPVDGGYNPATGTVSPSSVLSFPCEVVMEDYQDAQVDGTVIQRGDRMAIVSRVRLATVPQPDTDTLEESGQTWRVINVTGYSSGAHEAAYRLQVRR